MNILTIFSLLLFCVCIVDVDTKERYLKKSDSTSSISTISTASTTDSEDDNESMIAMIICGLISVFFGIIGFLMGRFTSKNSKSNEKDN
jgi:hypothetical protein